MKFIILSLLFSSNIALGCFAPSSDYFMNPDRMYILSDAVVIAKAIEHIPGNEEEFERDKHRFEVVRYLDEELGKHKDSPKNFTRVSWPEKSEASNFNNHEDMEFWADSFAGNSIMPGDCGAYGYYEIGKEYLIFMQLMHPKAQEPITSEDDKWLKLVEYIAQKYKLM
ncbi:MAG: hypothetical protein ACSHWU_06490 [Marinicella sp.]